MLRSTRNSLITKRPPSMQCLRRRRRYFDLRDRRWKMDRCNYSCSPWYCDCNSVDATRADSERSMLHRCPCSANSIPPGSEVFPFVDTLMASSLSEFLRKLNERVPAAADRRENIERSNMTRTNARARINSDELERQEVNGGGWSISSASSFALSLLGSERSSSVSVTEGVRATVSHRGQFERCSCISYTSHFRVIQSRPSGNSDERQSTRKRDRMGATKVLTKKFVRKLSLSCLHNLCPNF